MHENYQRISKMTINEIVAAYLLVTELPLLWLL